MYFNDLHVRTCFHDRDIRNNNFEAIPKCSSLEFIASGNFLFYVGDRCCKLKAPVLFWTKKGEWYHLFHNALDGYYEHFCIDMVGERANRIVAALDKSFPRRTIRPADPVKTRMFFSEMVEIFRTDERALHATLVLRIEELMHSIFANPQKSKNVPRDVYRLSEISDRICNDPFQKIDLEQVCRERGLTVDYFRRLFKMKYHCTFMKFIREHRMLYASQLLQEGNLRIKEVAEKCGFDQLPTFSRAFKRYVGIPPSMLKK